MKTFKISLTLFAFLVISATGCKDANIEKPTNVIILLVDDMGYGDVAAHGNPILKTPNFDVMHDQSARFTNFAVSPTCAPTRAALMTGKHEFLSGVTHTIPPMNRMDPESVTIAELFQEAGFKTGLFGKWHLGQEGPYGPWYKGFDETLTVPGDMQRPHYDPVLLKNQVEKQYKGYRTDILFHEAMNFIKEYKDSAFFCYIATYSPHAPNVVPEKYSAPYEKYRNESRDPETDLFIPEFFGQVANVDENLGKLTSLLDSLELDQNTLIIAMNDNGGTRGVDTYNGGRRGVKTTAWSGGTKAYSFWRWGNHFNPGERDLLAGHIDVLPTLAALCDLNVSEELQKQLRGNNLLPVLNNPEASLDETRMQVHHIGRWDIPGAWREHKYANATVRWGNYTLVRIDPCDDERCLTCTRIRHRGTNKTGLAYTNNPDHYKLTAPGKWELYNLKEDPYQSKNIADEHPEIVQKMSDFYEAWWAKVEVVMKKRF